MTLVGAINFGNKKILFADRKWEFSNYKRKIFTDEKEENYLVVSGFVLKKLIDEFQENKKHKSVEYLIRNTYSNTNFPGTSFLNYNSKEDSLNAYFIDGAEIKSAKVINYLFLGLHVKGLEGFDFRDINHTLISTLRIHHRKYPESIGNICDVLIFQNKIPVWMNAKLD